MKGTSYIIMWLTLFLVLILAMVLGLVLLLIAEFYCSPLIHRRRQLTTSAVADTTTTTGSNSSTHSPSALDSHTSHADTHHLNDVEKQLPESPENQESGGTQRQDRPEMQKGCLSDSINGSSLVYISNPIYGDGNGTPFETPGSSPSRLETEDSSGDDATEEIMSKVEVTPPMKKVPVEACLKDVGSLGSDTNSNNGVSSSWSLTPCTSPSL